MVKPDPHLWIDEKGVVRLDDTGMKVRILAAVYFSYGCDAGELHAQYPHLTPAQVQAVAAYADEHRESLEKEFLEEEKWVEALRKEMGDSPLQQRLRELKQA